MNNDYAVVVENLTKRYGRLVALDDFSIEIKHGEILGLLGRNGAGKTTLIEILEGLRKADAGEVRVLGYDPATDLQAIKERIGIQLQASSFFRKLRVLEVLRQFRNYYEKQADLKELLEMVALQEKANAFIGDLSGGQKQRLALALAFVNDPEIIFLDEPTAGLDPQVRRQLWHTIERMKQAGKTILLTTHYIEEAERLCDRVCIIDAGRKVALDTPANLIALRQTNSNRVRFSTLKPFSFEHLKTLTPVSVSENGANIYVAQAQDTARSIIDLIGGIEQQHNQLLELQISQATLEDAFIEITGKEIQT